MDNNNIQSESKVTPGPFSDWGKVSRGFCIFGGVIAIFGGLSLAGLKSQGDNNMLEAIANGMGYYFIGKGIFMIAVSLNFREALQLIRLR